MVDVSNGIYFSSHAREKIQSYGITESWITDRIKAGQFEEHEGKGKYHTDRLRQPSYASKRAWNNSQRFAVVIPRTEGRPIFLSACRSREGGLLVVTVLIGLPHEGTFFEIERGVKSVC